jgi:hypothetical protein
VPQQLPPTNDFMPGDWIKVETATPEKPEVFRLARLLSVSRSSAFGAVVIFWAWLDRNSSDGNVDGIVGADVDDLVGIPGFSDALQSVGWLHIDATAGTMTVPHYERMNGQSAKSRALKNDRQSKWRATAGKVVQKESKKQDKGNGATIAGFDAFWQIYPRHEARDAALKAWIKLAADESLQARILAAVEAQKANGQWSKDNGKYIPHPASWLNARRWEDEVKPDHDPGRLVI